MLEAADGRLVGIEVKAGEAVNKSDFAGLRNFQSRAGERFHLGQNQEVYPQEVHVDVRFADCFAGAVVALVGVDREFADDFAGGGVDDADVVAVDEHDDGGSVEGGRASVEAVRPSGRGHDRYRQPREEKRPAGIEFDQRIEIPAGLVPGDGVVVDRRLGGNVERSASRSRSRQGTMHNR